MTQAVTQFNPNEKVIKLKSKAGEQEYLPVQWRLVWFRTQCPGGTITTELVHLDLEKVVQAETFVWNAEKRRSEKVIKEAQGIAVFRATITNGEGGSATGTGSESAADFADFIEKAETKAIGRALAGLGYGTQFAPELNEMPRIVDAPVASDGNQQEPPATEQQIAAIQKMCKVTETDEPDINTLSYQAARALIAELTEKSKQQIAERSKLQNGIAERLKQYPEFKIDDIKRDVGLGNKRNGELSIADLAKIDAQITKMAQRMMAPAQ
jgi:hypothetical protein